MNRLLLAIVLLSGCTLKSSGIRPDHPALQQPSGISEVIWKKCAEQAREYLKAAFPDEDFTEAEVACLLHQLVRDCARFNRAAAGQPIDDAEFLQTMYLRDKQWCGRGGGNTERVRRIVKEVYDANRVDPSTLMCPPEAPAQVP